MKALIISDIHANVDALQAVLAAEKDADAIYCAGDLVDWGCHPHEVIALVRRYGIQCVFGNHDRHLLDMEEETAHLDRTQPYTLAEHCCAQMSKEDFAFLRTLPEGLRFELDGVEYYMTHHYATDYTHLLLSRTGFEAYWREKCPDSDMSKPRCLIFGHTHRAGYMMLADDMRWLNPGSVSYRRIEDPTKNADYAVIEDGVVHLRYVAYPREHLLQQVLEMNLTETAKRTAVFFYSDRAEI